jgi:hypothetical protein
VIENHLQTELDILSREQTHIYKYFVLENILVHKDTDHSVFVDIYLLADTRGYSNADLTMISHLSSNIPDTDHYIVAAPERTDFELFKNIEHKLMGYARMIYYEARGIDKRG